MHKFTSIAAIALAAVGVSAHAAGSGTWFHDGKEVKLPHTYAFRLPSPYEQGKQVTRILFTATPIDGEKLAGATDREAAQRSLLAGSDYLDLNLSAAGEFEEIGVHEGYNRASVSGSGWYDLKLMRNDGKHVAGSFRTKDAARKQSENFFKLTFDLDLLGAAKAGAGLPTDGGEQGKAYHVYLAALKKGDLDALQAAMTSAQANKFAQTRNMLAFKMMFGMIQSGAPQDPHFDGGHSNGQDATLTYSGKDTRGDSVVSTVAMRLEGDAWKIDKVSNSSRSQ